MAFLKPAQIFDIGFREVGKNVQISDKAVFYNPGNISIGDHSRIDDFCILSAGDGGIFLGKYVHIGCHSTLIGKARIMMHNYSGLSSRVAIYSSSDKYDGEWMTNPCVPENVRKTYHSPVELGKHVVVGTGSTILPGVELTDGIAVGAMSLVNESWYFPAVLVGIPARPVKNRKPRIFDLEKLIDES